MAGAHTIQLSAYERVQVAKVLDYIDAHLGDALDPELLARMHGISAYKLKTGLIQATDSSFACYVKRKRMERAKLLLRDTNKIIFEIARECGYRDASSFYRAFKKHFGYTPDTCRKL